MGTNYYADTKPCVVCGRSDEQLHIGKRSGGWEFSFQGYESRGLVSADDWFAYLKWTPGVQISSDEDSALSLDELIFIVRETRGKRNHYDYCAETGIGLSSSILKDKDGWAFTMNEFS